MGYSILSGGLTLACMVLPIFIRVAESGIRNVAVEHRHAATALGLSKWTTIFRIILPAALPGLLAAFTLGLTRALAENGSFDFYLRIRDSLSRVGFRFWSLFERSHLRFGAQCNRRQ